MQQTAKQATRPAQGTSSPVPISGTNFVEKAGRLQKPNSGPLVIPFGFTFASAPFVTISPFWSGSREAVGTIYTITDIQPDAFTVTSGNFGPNFYIDWIALGNPQPQ
jgi:hypothetical protein